ncbi:MAG: Na+/H+ antiporter subunit G [Calditrichaeota bacterium]|nr:Na+/H+ antiporter subunit G [Calditrichota bacterium]RQV98801.1 MAG: Na+/H+ antiporter subunit G [Calditrichota bacterium]
MSNLETILVIIGLFFNFAGCVGLIRFPDIYNRLQASTKCVTLGTALILMAVVIHFGWNSISLKALFCIVFIFLTAPTAAHAISRGSHRAGFSLWEGSVMDRYKEDYPPEARD